MGYSDQHLYFDFETFDHAPIQGFSAGDDIRSTDSMEVRLCTGITRLHIYHLFYRHHTFYFILFYFFDYFVLGLIFLQCPTPQHRTR